MADIMKRVMKHRSGDLLAGEALRGAMTVLPAGSMGGAWGAVAGSRTSPKPEDTSGLAAGLPHATMWWALTDQRFLAWSGRFKPKQLECALPLHQLTGIVINEQKTTWGVGVSFADGSHRRVEAPLSGNDVASFAGAAAAAGLIAG